MECPRCPWRTDHTFALFAVVAHLMGDEHYIPPERAWVEASAETLPRPVGRQPRPLALAGRICDICAQPLTGLRRVRHGGPCYREFARRAAGGAVDRETPAGGDGMRLLLAILNAAAFWLLLALLSETR